MFTTNSLPFICCLQRAVELSCSDLGLRYSELQFDKVFQLYGQMLVRHGVMLVGPTCGGKTTVRNLLQRALTLLPSIETETSTVSDKGFDYHFYV